MRRQVIQFPGPCAPPVVEPDPVEDTPTVIVIEVAPLNLSAVLGGVVLFLVAVGVVVLVEALTGG